MRSTAGLNQAALDELVGSAAAKRGIRGCVFHITSKDRSLDLISAAGNMRCESRYYIASVNKLFVSAILLRFWVEGKLRLDDRLTTHLPEAVVEGLHRYQGRDYSSDLTITHLLSHTSGLPCYLTDRQAGGSQAISELEAGIDRGWPMDRVLTEVKQMKPHFAPGQKGRAKYGDTNFRILGVVIEKIAGEPLNRVLNSLFLELGMADTCVIEGVNDRDFVPIHFRAKPIHISQFLVSTREDILSTARDQMIFLRAFFGGHFFPRERLADLERWNRIFFPFQYGIGIQKFSLSRLMSPFRPVPEMVGHCGSTGSVAFYIPARDLYMTGTTNDQAKPNSAFQTMIRILQRL